MHTDEDPCTYVRTYVRTNASHRGYVANHAWRQGMVEIQVRRGGSAGRAGDGMEGTSRRGDVRDMDGVSVLNPLIPLHMWVGGGGCAWWVDAWGRDGGVVGRHCRW